ncbi:MAG: 1-acyl-sn-glycerol-3-phosphate acyltransferase [Prevotellaceae bacterium]|jgi:hypothetical protein|nr:1-acyl-sn-glycerol-3-phosphate acyltransferase [Prevotellaceae bacterium]
MNFDEIRSFRDEEIPHIIETLLEEKQFLNVLSTVFPLVPKNVLKEKFGTVRTVKQFQYEWDYPLLKSWEDTKTSGIELRGVENIDTSKSYVFISNHRDILLDAAFLCIKLMEKNLDTVEIAIGDNLLIFPWIKDLVRINKSFIVRRGLNIKDLLLASKELSAYIRHDITERGQSVWLAQREGRAKNSDDRTQESILKMLNMSGEGDFVSNLQTLNICPLTISYEYDPCDYLKASELQQRRDNPDYHKSPKDDMRNMETGALGYKGKVVYQLSGDISADLDALKDLQLSKNEQITYIAESIDKKIHKNYEIYPNNKIAYDLLLKVKKFENEYTLQQKLDFERYVQLQIQKIDLPNKDENFLSTKLLEMYANPLINKLKAEN